MKKFEVLFSFTKILVDAIMIFIVLSIVNNFFFAGDLLGSEYIMQTIFISILFLFIFFYNRMYYVRMYNSKIQEFANIFILTGYAFMFYVTVTSLAFDLKFIPIKIYLKAVGVIFILIPFFLFIGRFILNKIHNFLVAKSYISKNNLLIITNKECDDLIKDIGNSKIYTVVGYVNLSDSGISLDYLGNDFKIEKILLEKKIDEVIYVDSDFNDRELSKIYEFCRFFGIRFRYELQVFEISKINTNLSLLHRIPLVEINNEGLDTNGALLKRLTDLIVSLISIVVLSPVILLCFLLIIILKRKNPFIRIESIGQYGNIKNFYVFNVDGTNRFKTFLRKLPLLFNVLFGNMSLVGFEFITKSEKEIIKDYESRAFNIKPGIFSLFDSNHGSGHINDKLRMNLFYIEKWSLIYDLKVFLKSINIPK